LAGSGTLDGGGLVGDGIGGGSGTPHAERTRTEIPVPAPIRNVRRVKDIVLHCTRAVLVIIEAECRAHRTPDMGVREASGVHSAGGTMSSRHQFA
jgi:hypothetical protein